VRQLSVAQNLADTVGTRIVLAQPRGLMLDALEALLERAGLSVVARCTEIDALERCLLANAPDLALVDAEMAGDREVADLIRAAWRGLPGGRVVLLVPGVESDLARDTLQLAIDGVLLKRSSSDDVIAGLHRIVAGDAVFPAGWLAAAHRAGHSVECTLSVRQLEVLELLAQGMGNERIAERLYISRNTVKFHVAAIYQRLGVRNRVQAAAALAKLRTRT
jgi:two-component system, NarL family, response regulator DesR